MADENGYNFRLRTFFSDGDVVDEYYVREESIERAKRGWRLAEEADTLNGSTYSITNFEVKEL